MTFEFKFFCVPTCFHMRIPNSKTLFVRTPRKVITLARFVNISPTVVIDIYINGKVFTITTTWKPKNLILFSKKLKIEFWLLFWHVPKCWNHLIIVNISPTVVPNWYINGNFGKVFTITTAWIPKKLSL